MESGSKQHQRIEESPEREATFGTFPVLANERVWGFADFSWVNIGLAIATWAFLTGGATAAFVGVEAGIAAMIIGNVIAVPLMALSTCIASGKYGLEQYTWMRSALGRVGIAAVVFTVILLIELGWTSVLAIMFGRATTNVTNEIFDANAGPSSILVIVFALIAIAVSWLVLARGPLTIRFLNRIVAPGLAVVTVVMLILIFTETSWSEMREAKPLAPFEDERLNFLIAIEFNLATGFSWWPVMGSLARLTTTPRAALWPNMIGIFGATVVAQIVGLMAALTLGDSDPTVWMIPLGGTLLGVVALIFVAFANVTSMSGIIYSTCLALRQAGGGTLARVRWEVLTAGFFVLPAILVIASSTWIYDNFLKFVVWGGTALASLAGITIADYFFLRRRRLEVRALYDDRADSPYGFWKGINPAAAIALVAGILTYVALLNPQTLDHRGAFEYLSASLPAFVVAALVHVVLTKLVVERMGWGGYGPARERAATEPAGAASTVRADPGT
jgi:nucleobase:cation symporter-1, NCS1 family